MDLPFEQLARSETPNGAIVLWRRVEPTLGVDVFEVKLGDEYLMSSMFTVAEEELAHLALAEVAGGELDVVVGGLGLGFTARAVLEDDRVRSLIVIDALAEVIDWHEQGLVPGADELTGDSRAELIHGDFFAMASSSYGLDPSDPDRKFDAILVDIDHTPTHHLDPSHAAFYSDEGMAGLASHLKPDGVFGFWSDDPPDNDFITLLLGTFEDVDARVVEFENHLIGGHSTNTVYVATLS